MVLPAHCVADTLQAFVKPFLRNLVCLRAHEEANAARKLTTEQRKENQRTRVMESTSQSIGETGLLS